MVVIINVVTITKARGFSISDNIKNIIFYAKNLIKQGIKEIVLTGVNIGDYGKQNLLELIQAIELSYLLMKRI